MKFQFGQLGSEEFPIWDAENPPENERSLSLQNSKMVGSDGVIEWDPFFWGIKQYKFMVIFRDLIYLMTMHYLGWFI